VTPSWETTTLVEAIALGRQPLVQTLIALGFCGRCENDAASDDDLNTVNAWVQSVQTGLISIPQPRRDCIGNAGAINEISVAGNVPIANFRNGIAEAGGASIREPQKFARCILLKTAQWALIVAKRFRLPPSAGVN